ncbi:MAG: CrcB family protein [Desulfosalsimonadaceae bacterium]
MAQRILLLCLAGAAGTLCRYTLAGLTQRAVGTTFPWGTLAVNTTGCFAAGLLWALFEQRWPVSSDARVIVMIGFMGAFTTFSTYILESGEFLRTAQYFTAAGNFFLQNGLGFLALMAGIALGRITTL